jgi:hypothetical protein
MTKSLYKFENGYAFVEEPGSDEPNTHGFFILEGGARYVGQFHQEKLSGFGVMFYPNKGILIGKFTDGFIDDVGTYIYPDGFVFIGHFEKNQVREGIVLKTDGEPLECNELELLKKYSGDYDSYIRRSRQEGNIELTKEDVEYIMMIHEDDTT